LKTGIIGARGVGKSTVFHALTGLAPLAGQSEGRNRARPGQIKVADQRLDFLERTYGSRKRVEVELTVLDFAPNPKEQKEGAALDPSLLPLIRDLDALLIVIPAFAGNQAALPAALAAIEAELVCRSRPGERRLERLVRSATRLPNSTRDAQALRQWLERARRCVR
jgi:ribosome-binding ATPase YchF (GTP1/OBG family)